MQSSSKSTSLLQFVCDNTTNYTPEQASLRFSSCLAYIRFRQPYSNKLPNSLLPEGKEYLPSISRSGKLTNKKMFKTARFKIYNFIKAWL